MKLSDLTTDETLDVLCEITPCVEHIVKDEGIINTIGTAVDTKGMTKTGVLMAGLDRIGALVPVLLKDHRSDLYHILGAVNQVDPAEIAAQKLTVTLTQIDEVFHDEELLTFFKLFGRQAKKAPSAPSAPPPASGQEDTSASFQPS